ncbi:MAG TPA: hypothetical protein VIH99_12200 [Bdellovibrionota bacterium]|jgi:hypothetical protein
MKLFSFFALFCMLIVLTGCPKKQAPTEEGGEPIEGSTTAANDKSSEAPSDEMQEKKGGDTAEPAAEEKK